MNRYEFSKESANTLRISGSIVKILEEKRIKSDFCIYGTKTESFIDKCLIIVIAGEIKYCHSGNKPAIIYNNSSGEIWIGKKWLNRRKNEYEKSKLRRGFKKKNTIPKDRARTDMDIKNERLCT